MKTADLWNRFIANAFNEKKMNFSYNDFEKAINERIKTELAFISVEEKLPENYNCQILVKKENENLCDLRFFHHEEQFKLLCSIHKYTYWRLVFSTEP